MYYEIIFEVIVSQVSHFNLTVSTFPDDEQTAVIAGGQEGLVVVEGDGDGGGGVCLELVDAGLAAPGHVEEIDAAILRGGDDTLSTAVGHEGSKAGPDVEVRVNHRELPVEAEGAEAVSDRIKDEAVVSHIDEEPGGGGGGSGDDAGDPAALSHDVPVSFAQLAEVCVHLEGEHRAAVSPCPDKIVLERHRDAVTTTTLSI